MIASTAPRTFVSRIGYCVTCVLPAEALSNEPIDEHDPSTLRADASQDGLSYLSVSHIIEDGLYLARVAAAPERAANGYTVLLSEEQLYPALPWDQRLSSFLEDEQRKRPECVLALLHAHAAEVRPLEKRSPEEERGTVPVLALAGTTLTPLDTVEVSDTDLKDAIALETRRHPRQRTNAFHVQQAFLSAMIDTLMTQLYQTKEHTVALTLKARCGLLAQLQRWHRCTEQGRLVNAVAVFSPEHGQRMWRLTAGISIA